MRHLPGPPGAPTLFLLHGWLATADLNWFRTYRPLGDRFGVVAIDHRGHGRGIRSARPFRLEDCADDVAAAAEVLGLEPLIAVGYSMGGPIAQLLWRRHPEQVRGLVLCATARNFRGRPHERMAFSALGGAALAVRATPPPVRRQVRHRLARRRHDDTPTGRWAREQFRRSDVRTLLEAGRALGSFTSHEWIGEVDVPTAIVLTERDELVPPHRQTKLARSIPGSTVHPVDGTHTVCADADAEVRFVPPLLEAIERVAG